MTAHINRRSVLFYSALADDRWDEAYARLGVAPFGFMMVRGGAQA